MTVIDSILLVCQSGSSDKFYEAEIIQGPGGCRVQVTYGRNGTAGTNAEKTKGPVGIAEARRVFDDLVKAKQKKGYRPVGQATSTTTAPTDVLLPEVTGCQLLSPIDADQLAALVASPYWGMQQKMDGIRLRVLRIGRAFRGVLRSGAEYRLTVNLEKALASCFAAVDGDLDVDGELVGNTYHLFDALQLGGKDLTGEAFEDRYKALSEAFGNAPAKLLKLVPTEVTPERKQAMLAKLRKANAEGVVLRGLHAPYKPGRTGGLALAAPAMKFKFYETAVVRVLALNAKRSALVGVRRADGQEWAVGNVTLPANAPAVEVNDLLDVRYLYYYEGGSLYQPVFQRRREDVSEPDALASLKRKPVEESAPLPAPAMVTLAGGGQIAPVVF